MFRTAAIAFVFLLAALWEAHLLPFLPAWAAAHPLWPLVVAGLCLEADRAKLLAGLLIALAWEELARPATVPPVFWLLVPLLFGASWLLRVWLSHRSTWSAVLLALLGRLALLVPRVAELSSGAADRGVWKAEAWASAAVLPWDILLAAAFLQAALFLARRLAPYLPRSVRSDPV